MIHRPSFISKNPINFSINIELIKVIPINSFIIIKSFLKYLFYLKNIFEIKKN